MFSAWLPAPRTHGPAASTQKVSAMSMSLVSGDLHVPGYLSVLFPVAFQILLWSIALFFLLALTLFKKQIFVINRLLISHSVKIYINMLNFPVGSAHWISSGLAVVFLIDFGTFGIFFILLGSGQRENPLL